MAPINFPFIGYMLIVFVAFFAPSQSSDRIVGGQQVDIADYPYQVALYKFGWKWCGGSIVDDHLVVTAAHCIDPSAQYSIRVGSSSNEDGGEVYQIDPKDIIVHEKYSLRTIDYDIALLRVSQPIVSGSSLAKPVALPRSGQQPPVGKLAKVSGWGRQNQVSGKLNQFPPPSRIRSQLHAVEVPIVAQSVCQEAYAPWGREITEQMICAGYVGIGGKDSCDGDSGGPMVVDGVLVGVVSWGRGCADERYPGVYSNVANLRDWIKEHGNV